MIVDYEKIQAEVETHIHKLGFTLLRDEDFLAIYENEKGWKIVVEGERYVRPSFDLSIVSNGSGEEFSIWILMEVFSVKDGSPKIVPNLTNQLKFLSDNFGELFGENPWFKEKYDEINSAWE